MTWGRGNLAIRTANRIRADSNIPEFMNKAPRWKRHMGI